MKKEELTLYRDLLGEIKSRVRVGQHRAALAANAELIALYWDIGRMIAARQEKEGWGTGVIPRLAVDLKNELPDEKGFSERNLKYMIRFAREYGQQPASQLKSADAEAIRIVQRPVAQFDTAVTTPRLLFSLPIVQRSVAQLPWGINITLLEKVKHLPTIGLILCQTKDRIFAEYALRDIHKPIGLADYEFTRALPTELASSLPSIEFIENELADDLRKEENK